MRLQQELFGAKPPRWHLICSGVPRNISVAFCVDNSAAAPTGSINVGHVVVPQSTRTLTCHVEFLNKLISGMDGWMDGTNMA